VLYQRGSLEKAKRRDHEFVGGEAHGNPAGGRRHLEVCYVSLADTVRQHVVASPSVSSFMRLPGPSFADQLPVLVQPFH